MLSKAKIHSSFLFSASIKVLKQMPIARTLQAVPLMKTPLILLCGLVLAAGLLLDGCVAQQMESQRANLINRGYPPAYADGYGAGYGSGLAAAGNPYAQTTKDVDRYLSDAKYKTGWDDGFNAGKGSYEATGRALR